MISKKDKSMAKRWFTITIVSAVILSIFNYTIQVLQKTNTSWNISVPIRMILLFVPASLMYFLPLLRANYFAKEENNRPLSIISKVLIVHFYCCLGIGVAVTIAYCFSAF